MDVGKRDKSGCRKERRGEKIDKRMMSVRNVSYRKIIVTINI